MDSQINPGVPAGHGIELPSRLENAGVASQDVASRYLTLAVRSAPMVPASSSAGVALSGLSVDSPFAVALQGLVQAMQADGGRLHDVEAKLIRQLVSLVQQNPAGSNEVAINAILGLVADFVGPSAQPMGLGQVHAEALSRLINLTQGGKAAALDVLIAIYDLRRFALEGANPLEGAYSGLTQTDVEAVPGLPGPAPDPGPTPPAGPTPEPGAASVRGLQVAEPCSGRCTANLHMRGGVNGA